MGITKRDECRLANVSFYLQFYDDTSLCRRMIRGQLTPPYFDQMSLHQRINFRGELPSSWVFSLFKEGQRRKFAQEVALTRGTR